jgi:hypothetical protein
MNSPHNDYFECHITLEPQYRAAVEPLAKEQGFKVSSLVGDEFVGDDLKVYCTTHAKTETKIRTKMAGLTGALTAHNIPFLRRKIEHIIYDERYVK